MKKLLLALLASCVLSGPVCAEEEYAVIGCKIVLDKNEYTRNNGKISIHEDTVASIFESFKAWQMLEFKVFIYVECPSCGMAHLVDYQCPNENCRSRLQ
jgi:hypothetical protein